MRILGGEDSSRLIKVPKIEGIRPTNNRARKALFDILQQEITGIDVLDLFSGSGAIGLEAISRGASSVCFAEKEEACLDVIYENIRQLGYDNKTCVLRGDVFKALKHLDKEKRKFDIIVMDPPYRSGLAKKALLKISTYDIIKPSTLIVVEHNRNEDLPPLLGNLRAYKKSFYGDTALSFYKIEGLK
ncbi:MAG: 16S rRNA (guanine(966)-N(2))-methyltransferase RsmD [Candidatus Omnitrophota bacterium]